LKSLPDQELAAKVAALVERGQLDKGDPAYGVALAAIDLGYGRLTRAQRGLYDRVVAPALAALESGAPPPPRPAPPSRPAAAAQGDNWKPVREAPSDRDVQLAMLVGGEVNALAFACRKSSRGWVNSATGKTVYFQPSHWREWRG
jgi:hypothetical protein